MISLDNKGLVYSQAGRDVKIEHQHNYQSYKPDPLLRLATAPQAAFNALGKDNDPQCLRNTRVQVLQQIHTWTNGDDGRYIFWLSGWAGTGKSTIARTIAREYYDKGCLMASFFFSRGGGDVSHAGKFVGTIATQLAQRCITFESILDKAISNDKDICGRTLKDQWNQLVLQPLSKLEADSFQSPFLIVIDALDECDKESDVRMVLQLLSDFRRLDRFHSRVFITSRPNIPVLYGFLLVPDQDHQDFVLHDISRSIVDDDIFTYLQHTLTDIQRKFTFDEEWPGDEAIRHLVRKAAGLFIWAATACRFIDEGGASSGSDRLSDILEGDSSDIGPEKELDIIYTKVLDNSISAHLKQREKDKAYTILREALGAIVILFSPLPAHSLARLLSMPKQKAGAILRGLYSILDIPKDPTQPVRLHHPSLHDFLLDKQRCRDERFWVDEKKAHEALAESCLRLMSKNLKRDICDLHASGTLASEVDSCRVEQCLPADLQYACRYWVQHLQHAQIDLCSHGQVYEFFQKHFLHWLEALSLIGKLSEGGHIVTELSMHLSTLQPGKDTELHAMMYDAKRFILTNGSVIEMAPLQVYSSALVFSPTKSVIKKLFLNQVPTWIKRMPAVEDNWRAFLQTLEGHSHLVKAVAFSPNGQLLASASYDNTVRLWDPRTGTSCGTLEGHSDFVKAVSFSPDSQLLASASVDKTVRLWEPRTGMSYSTLEGHSHSVMAVSFSPNSQLLASASADETVRLWDPRTGMSCGTLEGHSGPIMALSFSPDGQLLASASSDNTVRLWDPRTGMPCSTLEGHSSFINVLAFSPDSQLLASASADKTVRLWDPRTGMLCGTLEGHSGPVNTVLFSPDGQLLASASADHTVGLWDPRTGMSYSTLEGHSHPVMAVAFSSDGQLLASASADKTVRLWDPRTGMLCSTLEGHSHPVIALAFSPDSQLLASASYDNTVRLWDPRIGISYSTLKGHLYPINAVVFSPDGQFLASASADHTVRLWDPRTGILCNTLEGHLCFRNVLAFSPDSQLLASASYDNTVRLWDPRTGMLCSTLKSHSYPVMTLVFSPNGQLLASASDDYTVRLWDPRTGMSCSTFEGHSGPVMALAFSPDGQLLTSASSDHTVRLWDLRTGMLRSTLKSHLYPVMAVSFSPDGQLLASASSDHTVRLWDPRTGMSCSILKGHLGPVIAVSFSPNGQLLVSVSYDNTVRLWDPRTGLLCSTLEGYSSFRNALAFSPDSQLLASASVDNAVRLWDLRKQESLQILYLPANYQPTSLAILDNILAIGHMSGQVTFIGFDLAEILLGTTGV